MSSLLFRLVAGLGLVLALPGLAISAKPDVHYVPTHNDAVHRMLEIAAAAPGDRLVDLGSGDGRIVIQAVRDWGVDFATGIEIDAALVQRAREAAEAAGVGERTRFVEQDLFQSDFSDATIVTMYLLESLNLRLKPHILETLTPGTRIVSHVFGMGEWKPDQAITARGMHVYKWVVPARVAGDWRIETAAGESFTVRFDQRYQTLEGSYRKDGIDMSMGFAAIDGPRVRFSAHELHFVGAVEGDIMSGEPGPGAVPAWRATRIAPGDAS